MAFLKRFKRGRYSSLPAEDSKPDTPIKERYVETKGISWKGLGSHILIALLGVGFGLEWSHWSISGLFDDGYIQPPGNTPQIWQQNSTFTGSPSSSTQQAWEALIPVGKGFVFHPHLTPSGPKAVASYHSLHCLYGIRIAYYMRVNELHKLQNPLLVNQYIDNMGANEHLDHLDHYFEYLRQALMCAADSNLEDLEVNEKGEATAPGWGTQRVCRDFEGLGKWSRKWRASEDNTIL